MAYLKLDKDILESSLWTDDVQTKVFITALLMAERITLRNAVTSVTSVTGVTTVPPGCYGIVRASESGILRRACVDPEAGKRALEALCSADFDSRTKLFDGKRMMRIDGGFLVLNYAKYQDKDHTRAERQRRFRERHKADAAPHNEQPPNDSNGVTAVTVTESNGIRIRRRIIKTPPTPPKGGKVAIWPCPDRVKVEVWEEWLAVRKRHKAPQTERAYVLAIQKLDEFRGRGHDPNDVVSEAALNGWRGLFEPRQKGKPTQPGRSKESLPTI